MQEIPIFDSTNLSEITQNIEIFIKNALKRLKKDGAIIGLSGGLDSAVTATLLVRSLGLSKVKLLNMPEKDSKSIHQRHAKQLANHLGIKLMKRRINGPLRVSGTYRLLPLRFIPTQKLRALLIKVGKKRFLSDGDAHLLLDRFSYRPRSWMARANAYAMTKHRMRMTFIYKYADFLNYAVVGAANRTEWLTGTFSKWGIDHCADIMPIIHVYRSQLDPLAKYLQIPDYIRFKGADPDIIPGDLNKGDLLGGFSLVDQILFNLENGLPKEKLFEKFDKSRVEIIDQLWKNSQCMREIPYHL
ncbi:NH(3)-dependent NAD(+) synthetase [Candidatus Lokiarchaeum ossiferum]|uniref:NH(3)-dependent NAD(+) synthetase n=1 Tax=Candidatus Lokiarchaeum ossiferum TaxID=2951803 RepID=A0ABY6HM97_9ARCH|nr:NH(3)-dependent NAD(+) synthetase [Candidatus Lokiarchaeum sp. B-35]